MAAAAGGSSSMATIAVFGSLCAGTFGLGCWQATRYFEKVEMIQVREKELSMNASPLPPSSTSSPTSFQKYTVRGKFRHDNEVWIGPRGPPPGAMASSGPNSGRSSGGMSTSPQGFYVITPMELQNNTNNVVLVNRGWVPIQYVQQKKSWNRPTETVDVVGIVSSTEQPKWFVPPSNVSKEPKQLLWMDRQAIEEKTNTTKDSLLMTEISSNSNSERFPIQPSANTVGEFKVLPPTHAAYAFTWFGLSGAGVIMTRKLLNRLKK